jgi:transposase InsO family protein
MTVDPLASEPKVRVVFTQTDVSSLLMQNTTTHDTKTNTIISDDIEKSVFDVSKDLLSMKLENTCTHVVDACASHNTNSNHAHMYAHSNHKPLVGCGDATTVPSNVDPRIRMNADDRCDAFYTHDVNIVKDSIRDVDACARIRSNVKKLFTHSPFTREYDRCAKFILDSGANENITGDISLLSNAIELREPRIFSGLNSDKPTVATHIGHIKGRCGNVDVTIKDVYFVNNCAVNILSVSRMTRRHQATFSLSAKGCTIIQKDNTQRVFKMFAAEQNGLYILSLKMKQTTSHVYTVMNKTDLVNMWHCRLGHPSADVLKNMLHKKYGLPELHVDRTLRCDTCLRAKATTLPYKKSDHRATAPIDVLHADLCGPLNVLPGDANGYKYVLVITDDFSRYVQLYPMHLKSDTESLLRHAIHKLERSVKRQVKTLRTDNGGEFTSQRFESFLLEKGITHQLTVPYHPSQNGLAERMNRTIFEKARSMLLHAGLDERFLTDALQYAEYLHNRTPSIVLRGSTPMERFMKTVPNLSHIRTFGSVVYVKKTLVTGKFDERAVKGIFLGIPTNVKGYFVLIPKDLAQKTYHRRIARDCVFEENTKIAPTHPMNQRESKQNTNPAKDVAIIDNEYIRCTSEQSQFPTSEVVDDETKENDVKPNEKRYHTRSSKSKTDVERKRELEHDTRSKPTRVLPKRNAPSHKFLNNIANQDMYVNIDNDSLDMGSHVYISAAKASTIPKWIDAMRKELDQLEEKDVYDVVHERHVPKDATIIKSKWVYVEKDDDGKAKCKARLVAMGNEQAYMDDIYSPVASHASVRLLTALAARNNLDISSFDVSGAYLNAQLHNSETVYMIPPIGMKLPQGSMLKLKRALYGLRQSGKRWNEELNTTLIQMGYVRSRYDSCLYFFRPYVEGVKRRVLLSMCVVTVDDILIAFKQESYRKQFETKLSQKYKITKKSLPFHYAGYLIQKTNVGYKLSQPEYAQSILEEYKMIDCNPISFPQEAMIEPRYEDEEEFPRKLNIRKIIGSLLYLSNGTRPDIAYTVNRLASFQDDPALKHWEIIKRLLRYIKGTINDGITYNFPRGNPSEESLIYAYTDSDYASDKYDRKSISGSVIMINNSPVAWKSKKQPIVALSTAEAELIAATFTTQDVLYFKGVLNELGYDINKQIKIYEDNNAVRFMSNNVGANTDRTKHIDIRYKYVIERCQLGDIILKQISSCENTADIFTKPLKGQLFTKLKNKLYSSHEEGVLEDKRKRIYFSK